MEHRSCGRAVAVVLATAASLALPLPVLIAGFIRLRGWRPRSRLRVAAWAGAWIAGFALTYQGEIWGSYPANCPVTGGPGMSECPAINSPAVVSWGELGICSAWLVLGAVMTWILAAPAHLSALTSSVTRCILSFRDPGCGPGRGCSEDSHP